LITASAVVAGTTTVFVTVEALLPDVLYWSLGPPFGPQPANAKAEAAQKRSNDFFIIVLVWIDFMPTGLVT